MSKEAKLIAATHNSLKHSANPETDAFSPQGKIKKELLFSPGLKIDRNSRARGFNEKNNKLLSLSSKASVSKNVRGRKKNKEKTKTKAAQS